MLSSLLLLPSQETLTTLNQYGPSSPTPEVLTESEKWEKDQFS